MRKSNHSSGFAPRKFTTQASLDSYVWNICDILCRSNCAGALQDVPELTWILFLRILDDREGQEAKQAEAVGVKFVPSLESPYRWQDWAAPEGTKRLSLQMGALTHEEFRKPEELLDLIEAKGKEVQAALAKLRQG